ncbi:hypothetical protein AB0G79_20835 [Streptomyces sp. NPDC020807]|uniref:hypothetical protein n=1 Tax=Streptomyces sp. NPDC020807 TaxID=3155119 RepID=UPI0033D691F5
MTGTWCVLLEEETKGYASIDGHGHDLYRWHLTGTTEVAGGRAAADAAARALADGHVPEETARSLGRGGRPERRVYRMPDGAFLVQLGRGYGESRFRVSVGELVTRQEEVRGRSAPAAPTGLRRFFG